MDDKLNFTEHVTEHVKSIVVKAGGFIGVIKCAYKKSYSRESQTSALEVSNSTTFNLMLCFMALH